MCIICQLAHGIDMFDGCLVTLRVTCSAQRGTDNNKKAYRQNETNNSMRSHIKRHPCCTVKCGNDQVTSEEERKLMFESEPRIVVFQDEVEG